MDGAPSKSGAGGGAGPAPFLLKTYDMVDDSATDEIVSWSSNKNSFVVWNPPEFSRLLLPTYFKHNNFSSFIRQLNTYGFRKMDPERWEFTNEDFVKDQKHLLKNIHRRKPIHSHSTPQGSSAIDPERTAFKEEINKLTHEKTALEKGVSRFKQQQPVTKLQLEDLIQRVDSIERRQHNLLIFLENVIQNNGFVEQLARQLESMDFSVYYNKKRRLPQDDNPQMVPDDSFVLFRPEFGNVFHHDFINKLRLELSSAVSDINFISHSPQSSNKDGGNTKMATEQEQPELSDSGTSFTFNMDSPFMPKRKTACLDCTQPCLNGKEEAEGHVSYQLNLGLASFGSLVNRSQSNLSGENATMSSLRDNQAPVNDVFWEQFLTERPGSNTDE